MCPHCAAAVVVSTPFILIAARWVQTKLRMWWEQGSNDAR